MLITLFCLVGAVGMTKAQTPFKEIVVPRDTKVALRFTQPLSTATAKVGDIVRFETVEEVRINDTLIVQQGSPATGVITEVRPPRSRGRNAQLRISFQSVQAVDGSLVPLAPYRTPEEERISGKAPGVSVVGAMVLGPIGLVSGAFVRGDHVTIERGATVNAAIARHTVLPTKQDLRDVIVPDDTPVPLEFQGPVSTRTAEAGDLVDFVVSQDVYVSGVLIIAKGTPATGTVKEVKRPRTLGRNGKLEIELGNVKGVDGTLLPLAPFRSEKGIKGISQEAAGASAAGGVIFGPVGLVAGAFLKGRHVDIPAGAKGFATLAPGRRVRGALPTAK
jgi:hypothetical protein